METCISLLLLVWVTGSALAQANPFEKVYVNETIFRQGNRFIKGTELLRFQDLKYEFEKSEAGAGLYLQAKQNRTWSTVLSLASAGFLVAIGPATANSNNDRAVSWLLGGWLVSSMAGRYTRGRSEDQLNRAIWQRNRDVLFR